MGFARRRGPHRVDRSACQTAGVSSGDAAHSFRFEGVSLDRTGSDGGVLRVLDDVSTEWSLGGPQCVVGPSGSGKSTLLRLCNRLDVPTGGRVLFDGEDVATLDPLVLRRRVGMVFQRVTLFAGTVAANFAVARPDVTAEEGAAALRRVDLPSNLLDRPAGELSGGEGQRVCLARTLLTDPEVVLMDEVTSSLDTASRHEIEHLAHDLTHQGIGVVWVTHDLAQAQRLASSITVVRSGKVLDDDDARRYLRQATAHGTGTDHDWHHDQPGEGG
ncbi:MAG: ATP-binding cassette domain-containing protein [Acidimicrobiia bacterium]|nr:ATP-binding cassette domain-containing protein [Acidimicrobiia bacterium]